MVLTYGLYGQICLLMESFIEQYGSTALKRRS